MEAIIAKIIGPIVSKMSENASFIKTLCILVLLGAGASLMRWTLEAMGLQEFTRQAGFFYITGISWWVVCYFALPQLFEHINWKKVFWAGWLIGMIVAGCVDAYLASTGAYVPFVP